MTSLKSLTCILVLRVRLYALDRSKTLQRLRNLRRDRRPAAFLYLSACLVSSPSYKTTIRNEPLARDLLLLDKLNFDPGKMVHAHLYSTLW